MTPFSWANNELLTKIITQRQKFQSYFKNVSLKINSMI